MRILAISPHLPYPQIPHAGGVFLLAHLEHVAADHEVTVLVPASPEAVANGDAVPPGLDLRLTSFHPEPRPTVATQVERLRRRLRFAAIRTPALKGFRDAGVVELAAAADVVELHWIDTALLTRELRRAGVTTPLVVVAYDVTADSIPARGRRLHSRVRRLVDPVPTWIRRRTEAADLGAADLVVVFKEQDRQLLRRFGITTASHVVEPWLDVPPADATAPRTPRSVLFTGAMWRPENQDGVRWFLAEVWPRVVARAPEATFTIAGASPPAWLCDQAAALPGVTVTGTVPSLAPHYAAAAVFVAPLFVAGGLKFKVPQAMAHALPVIASSIAATGIEDVAPPGALWRVTDDADAMAAAVLDAFERPGAAAATGEEAARWVRQHFSFARSTAELLERYADMRRAGD